jgi:hypothetical protein
MLKHSRGAGNEYIYVEREIHTSKSVNIKSSNLTNQSTHI